MKNLFVTFLCLCLLTSCNAILIKMYGLHTKYVEVCEDNRPQLAKEYGLKDNEWYKLELSYAEFLLDTYYVGRDTTEQNLFAPAINNHLQGLQAMYFDRQGKLVSYHTNCYAEGFPNLQWNHDGAFDVFPPASVTPLDTLVSLQNLLPHISKFDGTPIGCELDTADYTVVVMWPVFMGRQSKRLIKTVKKNLQLSEKSKTNILFVNNDAFQIMTDSIVNDREKRHKEIMHNPSKK